MTREDVARAAGLAPEQVFAWNDANPDRLIVVTVDGKKLVLARRSPAPADAPERLPKPRQNRRRAR